MVDDGVAVTFNDLTFNPAGVRPPRRRPSSGWAVSYPISGAGVIAAYLGTAVGFKEDGNKICSP